MGGVNGIGYDFSQPSQADQYNLQQFYKNLFRLQEDVFAGKHPRIQLPEDVLAKIRDVSIAQSQKPASTAPQELPNGKVTNLPTASPPGLATSVSFGVPSARVPNYQSNRPVTSSSKPPTSSSSSFDPILLTKSDELIKAEVNIKRQRIEQALEEQVAASKPQTRGKDFSSDYETGLNVDEVLSRALEVIKPVSGLPDEEGSEKESFDENDYYSSQAMSWSTERTSEGAEPSTSVQFPGIVADTAAAAQTAGPAQTFIPGISQPLPPSQSFNEPSVPPAVQQPYTEELDELPDEDDEDDYSPPPPDAATAPAQASQGPAATTPKDRLRPQQAYDSRYEYNRRSPPAANVPVIRSHIREPFAPQPSRVSPLALGKLPPFDQAHIPPNAQAQAAEESGPENAARHDNHSGNTTNGTSRQRSPAGPRQGVKNAKKRKRQAEQEDKPQGRKASGKRPARERQSSPIPMIKEEPVSPPPFASSSYVDAQPVRRRIVQYPYEDVEVISPRDMRARPVYYRDEYDRPVYRYPEPTSPTYVRMASPSMGSPSVVRRVERDDVDLRRVASLQYARRPISPGPGASQYAAYDRIPMEPQRSVRAASYAYADRERMGPPIREPIYRETSVRPQRYLRERSRSPPFVVERASAHPAARTERIVSPGLSSMPPPPIPTRIIEDKYGNRYYATPAPPDAPTGPIRPQSRAMLYEREAPMPAYERAVSRMSVVRERPAQHAYDDEMPPPQMPPPQRRYVEDVEGGDHRAYRQREYSMRPQEHLAREPVRIRERETDRERERDREGMPPPRAPLPEAVEGRQLLRYDDETSPRLPPRELAPPMPVPQTRAYSVRPEPIRREMYGEEIGRGIVRRGSAQPEFVREREYAAEKGYPEPRAYADVPIAPPLRGGRYVDEEDFDGYAGGRRGGYRL